jgi:hypothetical protein
MVPCCPLDDHVLVPLDERISMPNTISIDIDFIGVFAGGHYLVTVEGRGSNNADTCIAVSSVMNSNPIETDISPASIANEGIDIRLAGIAGDVDVTNGSYGSWRAGGRNFASTIIDGHHGHGGYGFGLNGDGFTLGGYGGISGTTVCNCASLSSSE